MPKMSVREFNLKAASEFLSENAANFTGAATYAEESEYCKHLKDQYKLSRKDIAEVTGLSERQAQTRLSSYKLYVSQGLIPTGMLPRQGDPAEEILEDEVAKQVRSSESREFRNLANQELLFKELTRVIGNKLPSQTELDQIETLYQVTKSSVVGSFKEEEAVVASISDLHLGVATKVHPFERSILANNNYLKKVIRIADIHRSHSNVSKVFLNLMGDLIENSVNFGSARWICDRPAIDQIEAVTELMVKNIETLLVNFDEVTVSTEVGNHGYLVSKNQSTEPHHSNWETVMGRSLMWAFRNNPRVTFNVNVDNWYQILDVLGTKIHLCHGHVMSGPGSFDGIVNQYKKWQAVTEPFDAAIHGHFHRLYMAPLPRVAGSAVHRTVYGNGTAIDHDEFLSAFGSSPTAQYWLLFAKGGEKPRITSSYAVDLYA